MTTYVAFVRAINVAGHPTVKMTDLVGAFADAGCRHARTCIQSGNVIFESRETNPSALFQKVRAKVAALSGEEANIAFRTAAELEGIVKAAPFKAFAADRSIKLYVAFLFASPPKAPKFPLVSNSEALEAVAMKSLEVYIVSRRKKSGFYGFPNNFVESELGVRATTRNWSTITRILKLVVEDGGPQ